MKGESRSRAPGAAASPGTREREIRAQLAYARRVVALSNELIGALNQRAEYYASLIVEYEKQLLQEARNGQEAHN